MTAGAGALLPRELVAFQLAEALRTNVAITRRSDWIAIDQPLIDRFAETTDQAIPLPAGSDPVQAAP